MATKAARAAANKLAIGESKQATPSTSAAHASSSSSGSNGNGSGTKKKKATVECSSCHRLLFRRDFTATQLKKRTGRVCNTCVTDKVAASTHDGSFVIACQAYDWPKANSLIQAGVDVNCFLSHHGSFYTALHLCCMQPCAPSKRDNKPTSPGTKTIRKLIDASSLRIMLRCKPWGISPIGIAAFSNNHHLVRLLTKEVVTRWRAYITRQAEEKRANDKKQLHRYVLTRALGDDIDIRALRWPPDWYSPEGRQVEEILRGMIEEQGHDYQTIANWYTVKRCDLMIDMLLAGPPKPKAAVTPTTPTPTLRSAIASSSSSTTSTATTLTTKQHHDDNDMDDGDDDSDHHYSNDIGERLRPRRRFKSSMGAHHTSLSDLIDERMTFILDDERDRFELLLATGQMAPALRVLPSPLISLIVLFCL